MQVTKRLVEKETVVKTKVLDGVTLVLDEKEAGMLYNLMGACGGNFTWKLYNALEDAGVTSHGKYKLHENGTPIMYYENEKS